MKTVSAGIIIINSKNQILGCKPFGKKDNRLDIPKGHIEDGETPYQAAIRETFEETGLLLDKVELEDKGYHVYMKNKDLHLFKCNYEIEDLSELKCTSFFELNECSFPEVDGYEWVNIEDIEYKFYIKLGPILREILN